MNIREAKQQIKNAMIAYFTKDEFGNYLLPPERQRPVFLLGAPGIGKSTLMLQICQQLGQFAKVLYVSGEESTRQLKLRAQRLHVDSENLYVLSETRLGDVLECVQEEQPDILIVDEVLSVGDFHFQQKCEARINRMKENGATILFVSHNMEQVRNLCSRIVWLEHGRVRSIGDADELCREYQEAE